MKWYVWSIIFAGLLVLVLKVFPGLAFLGFLALILPGFFLLLIPTLFAYLVSIAPAVLAYDLTRDWRWAVPLGVACLAAAGYGLPAFAQFSFERAARSFQSDDSGVLPEHVGPVVAINNRHRTDCANLCQGLLRLGPIQTVYVTDGTKSLAYQLKDPNCSLTDGTRHYPPSRCFYSEPGSAPSNVSLTITPRHLTGREYRGRKPSWPARMVSVMRVQFEGTEQDQITQRTYVEGMLPSTPFFLELPISAGSVRDWRPASIPIERWEDQAMDDIRNAIESAKDAR